MNKLCLVLLFCFLAASQPTSSAPQKAFAHGALIPDDALAVWHCPHLSRSLERWQAQNIAALLQHPQAQEWLRQFLSFFNHRSLGSFPHPAHVKNPNPWDRITMAFRDQPEAFSNTLTQIFPQAITLAWLPFNTQSDDGPHGVMVADLGLEAHAFDQKFKQVLSYFQNNITDPSPQELNAPDFKEKDYLGHRIISFGDQKVAIAWTHINDQCVITTHRSDLIALLNLLKVPHLAEKDGAKAIQRSKKKVWRPLKGAHRNDFSAVINIQKLWAHWQSQHAHPELLKQFWTHFGGDRVQSITHEMTASTDGFSGHTRLAFVKSKQKVPFLNIWQSLDFQSSHAHRFPKESTVFAELNFDAQAFLKMLDHAALGATPVKPSQSLRVEALRHHLSSERLLNSLGSTLSYALHHHDSYHSLGSLALHIKDQDMLATDLENFFKTQAGDGWQQDSINESTLWWKSFHDESAAAATEPFQFFNQIAVALHHQTLFISDRKKALEELIHLHPEDSLAHKASFQSMAKSYDKGFGGFWVDTKAFLPSLGPAWRHFDHFLQSYAPLLPSAPEQSDLEKAAAYFNPLSRCLHRDAQGLTLKFEEPLPMESLSFLWQSFGAFFQGGALPQQSS